MAKYRLATQYQAVVRLVLVVEAENMDQAETMSGPILSNGYEIDLITQGEKLRTYKLKTEDAVTEATRRLFRRVG